MEIFKPREIHFQTRVIRSMYVKSKGNLYIQYMPDVAPEDILKRKIYIDVGQYSVTGIVYCFTKSGIILEDWVIINANFC